MKRLALGIVAFLVLSTPAVAADDAKPKPTVEELQKQVSDLTSQVVFWQSAARSYREKAQSETDALFTLRAQLDQQSAVQKEAKK